MEPRQKSGRSKAPPSSAGRLTSPAWTDHLQACHSRLYLAAPRCVFADLVFLHRKSHKRTCGFSLSFVQSGVYRHIIIPENAPENLMGSSVANMIDETSILNGLSS